MTEIKNTPIAPSPAPVVNEPEKPKTVKENHPVPEYLKSVYDRRYFNPLISTLTGDSRWDGLKTFFCRKKLTEAVTNEVIPGNEVLQMGISSGTLERAVAEKMNSKGHYIIEDISPLRIDAVQAFTSPWLNVFYEQRDFTILSKKRYDVVILYFTLHELPDARKREAVSRAIASLKPSGKIVFIDYACPKPLHPMKHPVRIFNRLLEPFAESLWYKEIKDFAPKSNTLIWDRKTFSGDMYQCVIAQKH